MGWVVNPGKYPRYQLYRRLTGPQRLSGRIWKRKKICARAEMFFFFAFSCTLYFIRTCVFFLTIPHFAFYLYLQHTTQTSMPPGGIRNRNPSNLAAADPRLSPCGHQERQGFEPRIVQPIK
jgi:hypothetical protein